MSSDSNPEQPLNAPADTLEQVETDAQVLCDAPAEVDEASDDDLIPTGEFILHAEPLDDSSSDSSKTSDPDPASFPDTPTDRLEPSGTAQAQPDLAQSPVLEWRLPNPRDLNQWNADPNSPTLIEDRNGRPASPFILRITNHGDDNVPVPDIDEIHHSRAEYERPPRQRRPARTRQRSNLSIEISADDEPTDDKSASDDLTDGRVKKVPFDEFRDFDWDSEIDNLPPLQPYEHGSVAELYGVAPDEDNARDEEEESGGTPLETTTSGTPVYEDIMSDITDLMEDTTLEKVSLSSEPPVASQITLHVARSNLNVIRADQDPDQPPIIAPLGDEAQRRRSQQAIDELVQSFVEAEEDRREITDQLEDNRNTNFRLSELLDEAHDRNKGLESELRQKQDSGQQRIEALENELRQARNGDQDGALQRRIQDLEARLQEAASNSQNDAVRFVACMNEPVLPSATERELRQQIAKLESRLKHTQDQLQAVNSAQGTSEDEIRAQMELVGARADIDQGVEIVARLSEERAEALREVERLRATLGDQPPAPSPQPTAPEVEIERLRDELNNVQTDLANARSQVDHLQRQAEPATQPSTSATTPSVSRRRSRDPVQELEAQKRINRSLQQQVEQLRSAQQPATIQTGVQQGQQRAEAAERRAGEAQAQASQEKERADQEKRRADEKQKRADEEKARADQAVERAQLATTSAAALSQAVGDGDSVLRKVNRSYLQQQARLDSIGGMEAVDRLAAENEKLQNRVQELEDNNAALMDLRDVQVDLNNDTLMQPVPTTENQEASQNVNAEPDLFHGFGGVDPSAVPDPYHFGDLAPDANPDTFMGNVSPPKEDYDDEQDAEGESIDEDEFFREFIRQEELDDASPQATAPQEPAAPGTVGLITELRQALATANTKMEEADEELQEAQEANTALEKQVEKLKEELQKSEEHRATADRLQQSSRNDLENAKKVLVDAQQRCAAEKKAMQSTIDELNGNAGRLAGDLFAAGQKCHQEKMALQLSIDQLNAAAHQRVGELEALLAQAQSAVQASEGRANEAEKRLADAHAQYLANQVAIPGADEQAKRLAGLQAELDDERKARSAAEARANALEAQLAAAPTEAQTKRLADLEAELAAEQVAKTAAKERAAMLEKQLADARAAVSGDLAQAADGRVRELEGMHARATDTLRETRAAAETEKARLRIRAEEAEKARHEYKERMEGYEEEVEALREEIEGLVDGQDRLEKTLEKERESIAARMQACDRAKKDFRMQIFRLGLQIRLQEMSVQTANSIAKEADNKADEKVKKVREELQDASLRTRQLRAERDAARWQLKEHEEERKRALQGKIDEAKYKSKRQLLAAERNRKRKEQEDMRRDCHRFWEVQFGFTPLEPSEHGRSVWEGRIPQYAY